MTNSTAHITDKVGVSGARRSTYHNVMLFWSLLTLVGLGATGCGGASQTTGPVTHQRPIGTEGGPDSVLYFGHAASPADYQAVTTLVKRYYGAATIKDGVTACSLILSTVEKAVPEDYGEAPGPAYLRGGRTCPAVMTRLFEHFHRRLVHDEATLEVTRVRLATRGGYAVLRFGAPPEREITVVREGGVWKVSSLLDSKFT